MTRNSLWIWTALAMVVLGGTFIIVRQYFKVDAELGDLLLTYKIDFHVRKPDGRNAALPDAFLKASIPEATHYCRVAGSPTWVAPNMQEMPYGVHYALNRKNFVLRATKTGPSHCEITFLLRLHPGGDWRQHGTDAKLTPEERKAYLDNAKGMTANGATALEIVSRLRDDKPPPQELADRIYQECRNIESVKTGEDSADKVLASQKGSPLGRAKAMVTLCRAAKIPARLVTGFEIKESKETAIEPEYWVEAYAVDRWEPYDLENEIRHELPRYYMPVRREGAELVRLTNATDVKREYSIVGAPPAARSLLGILDLSELPSKLHEPIKVVLILPIGALLTSIVRTIIGIRTFGTFSPTLLALAFVYNDFWGGLQIFAVVLATGFISRGLLDRLKLLLVPRLSIILTLVVMLMVLGIAIANYFKPDPDSSGQTVLLPMVILTNLVERFYVTTEEDNFLYALRLMLTTLLMALAIYSLLNWKQLGNTLFDYPELHFFTVAVLIVIGRYTGYRLTELVRFRDLVRPREP